MDIAPYQARRARLIARMNRGGGGVAVIPTAPEQVRNGDAHFPYRPDSNFHYLTGFSEPDAVLILIADSIKGESKSILFCREKNLEREIWDGFRYGPSGACEKFGFDAARPISEFESSVPDLLADQPALWFSMGHDAAWDTRMTSALNTVRAQSRAGKRAPAAIQDARTEIHAMRLVKDASEIDLMRRAAKISAAAHRRAMGFAAPGRFEYEVEAELLHEFRRQGCDFPAYTPIVAGGANACVLHYVGNNQALRSGDLLLIDAGGEFAGYAGDITRTFPVNGVFSGPQADIYQLVLAAQDAAIAVVRPGASFLDPHTAALRVLVQGLLDLKLVHGTLDGAIEAESYKPFYMHRTSHWLGRDVHDAGEYKYGELWTKLVPGMALTVEPGCYIRPAENIPDAFWNIGVRIEDDLLVTDGEPEVLSAAAPKTVAEIEAVMRAGRE